MNYTPYHMHTMKSLLDSSTSFEEYVDKAIECGMVALGCSEHGLNREWAANQLLCKSKIDALNKKRAAEGLPPRPPLKYLNGVEIYMTESFAEKKRDNYHTILIAKNEAGRQELFNLIQLSTRDDHTYYNNRISFDEFLQISDNVIKISACIAGPLSKLPLEHPRYMELARHYDYLEIQHHDTPEQKAYNVLLWQLSCQLGKPLIAGTDTHSLDKYHAECRQVLMEYKNQHYPDEDKFDLTWKTYDELVEAYWQQGVLPEEVFLQAIENTNVMADSVEDVPIDTAIKYPILYGSHENDTRKFEELVATEFANKCESGAIKPDQIEAFKAAIDEEMAVFKKLDMTGFMLSMAELIKFCRDHNIPVGPGRGSVSGSRIAYIVGIVDLNPEDLNTVFSRFANEERVEIGDIDVDIVAEDDRPKIFKYILDRFGERNTARVGSYGTLADKAIIDCVGKVLHQKNPDKYSYDEIKEIKKLHERAPQEAREQYPDLFYYYDGLAGVTISQSVHPAGMVISPVDITSNYGTFYKDGVQCLLLNMDATHDVGLAKYDFLGLKSLAVIRDACKLANIPLLRYNTLDWDDQAVWDEIDKDADGLFQFESPFAADAIRKFQPRSVKDLALISACLRPSGASYRDKVYNHIPNKNPTAEMDQLFADSYGYLVYQEQIIAALIKLCGFTGGQADSVRRDIAKKKEEKVAKDVELIREGYCRLSPQPREVAEKECADMLQVIKDASGYSFNYNHAVAYSLVTYMFAWLRHYYPVQFIASYLDNANNEDDIATGTKMAKARRITIGMPKFGISKDGYGCDPEHKVIAQGIMSIKGFGEGQGDSLYALYHCGEHFETFIDLLEALKTHQVRLNLTLIDKLITLDFFSPEFGNQNELKQIKTMWECFKVTVNMDSIKGEPYFETIKDFVQPPKGKDAKTGKIIDRVGYLKAMEAYIKSKGIADNTLLHKAKDFAEIMGFNGYVSGRNEDRPNVYVKDVIPLKSRATGEVWAYALVTQSLGSGIESRFTVRAGTYDKIPVNKGQFIFCKKYYQDKKGYWNLSDYVKIA